MARFVRVIYPYYCGMRVRGGIASDYYGANYVIVDYDENELLKAVKKHPVKARRLLKALEELNKDLRIHSYLCSSFDCQQVRSRERFEFEIKILEELGVKYKKTVVTCPEKAPHLGEDYPSDVLLSAIKAS